MSSTGRQNKTKIPLKHCNFKHFLSVFKLLFDTFDWNTLRQILKDYYSITKSKNSLTQDNLIPPQKMVAELCTI